MELYFKRIPLAAGLRTDQAEAGAPVKKLWPCPVTGSGGWASSVEMGRSAQILDIFWRQEMTGFANELDLGLERTRESRTMHKFGLSS